jgi:hypothetical protein
MIVTWDTYGWIGLLKRPWGGDRLIGSSRSIVQRVMCRSDIEATSLRLSCEAVLVEEHTFRVEQWGLYDSSVGTSSLAAGRM